MARHPKKKPDEKAAPSDPNKKDKPSEIPSNQTEGTKTSNPLDRLFWVRVGLGILAGALAAVIGSPMDEASRIFLGLVLMIVLFVISYIIAKAMRIQLPSSDKKKLVMTGIGSYYFMFVFSWILVNTIIHPEVGLNVIR